MASGCSGFERLRSEVFAQVGGSSLRLDVEVAIGSNFKVAATADANKSLFAFPFHLEFSRDHVHSLCGGRIKTVLAGLNDPH